MKIVATIRVEISAPDWTSAEKVIDDMVETAAAHDPDNREIARKLVLDR